ncbi:DUF1189 domain-containing protein [Falsibacillus albus]|uniref:DUF1189 domain-containing protein n=1 Tax=Falsibacillus albus TaxID=2478915 RepID=A0A3L7K570_9BACI|nr:DUF1189 domain-containing protein [Falsibacillus albus]RLQ98213.1 DUF1189 domain-containing protein [Falsibacillus albus]
MNIFQQLIKSLYSPKNIARFRFQGIGKTILYVFMIMLISTIPVIYHFTNMTLKGIEAGRQTIDQELPKFSINNGVLTSEKEEPVFVEKNGLTILIDPTNSLTEKELKQKGSLIALLKNEAVIASNGQLNKYDYSTFNGLSLNNNKISSFLKTIKSNIWIILPVLFIVYYIFVAAIGFIKVSIFALVGIALARTQSRKLSYRHSWRITAYAITLPTVFFAIMDLLRTTVPFSALLDWLIIIIMLYLSIKEIPGKKVQE